MEEKTYVDQSYTNDVALGAVVQRLDNVDAIRSVFPVQIHTASFSGRTGFLNRDGGWANAGQGLSILLSKVAALGGKIFPGKAVKNLIRKEGRTVGVLCEDDDTFEAITVILATGSWTPSAFPQLNLGCACLATG
jgi:sarcosine oxidase/L-pipecolate oxidase